MMEKIKNIGWSSLSGLGGIFFLVAAILIGVFFLKGIVSFTENHQDLIEFINEIIIGIILLLLLLSTVPKFRIVTGNGIALTTIVWMFLLWLNCLSITYELWGIIGVLIGLIMAGVGMFATAIIAVLFTGQWLGALLLISTFLTMCAVRMLGYWIESKHKSS